MKYTGIIKYFFILTSAVLFTSCGEKPDAIYTNGKIYTMNTGNSVFEAMAVKEGKILDIGTSSDINSKYKSEDVIDLKGAVVLPGFIDSDGSIIEFSKNLNYINLSYAKSIDEIKNLVIEKTKNTNEGEWIGGYGWSEILIPEAELETINKEILDQIAPNYNVYLVNSTLNTAWVNSRLLRYLKIDKNTPNPKNGEIEKDANGEPTGLLYDEAVNLIKDNVPGLLKTEMLTQVEKGLNEIAKYGITEVHDRTIGNEGLEIFKELVDAKKFPIKVYAVLSGEDSALIESYLTKGPLVNYGDRLTIKSISLDYDGLFELQDAAMNDDYKDEPKKKVPYVTDEDIERVYSRAIEKNFQFSIKAIGDRAVSNSLSIIEKVMKQKNPKDPRTVIEYCEFVSPKEISRIGELKLIPSVRPDVCMNDIQILSQVINPENAKKIGLWNSLLKSAGMITSGSDFPFHQINPFVQIYFLTTRQLTDTVLSTIPNPDQKISLTEAVRTYTTWPAYASFEETTKGSLEKGKYADFIVVSKDIFTSVPEELLNTKVLMTVINGRVIYDSSKSRK
ncbi:MAG TPA: amidohydrolase [Ignavibacteria bacterium]|nr:amidohydrolase [Ignavibacteria bacterium]